MSRVFTASERLRATSLYDKGVSVHDIADIIDVARQARTHAPQEWGHVCACQVRDFALIARTETAASHDG